MGNDEYIKLINDSTIRQMRDKWIDYNGGKDIPVFNVFRYSTYEEYKEVFIKKYKSLGID